MNIVERQIANALIHFLEAKGHKIACDYGLLELDTSRGPIVATLSGKEYLVEIRVTRLLAGR